jgi:hypothetical protein
MTSEINNKLMIRSKIGPVFDSPFLSIVSARYST